MRRSDYISEPLSGSTGARRMTGSTLHPSTALRPSGNRRKTATRDDGRRWSPRSALLLGGGVSLAVWSTIIAIAVR
jgi:hypothetical protein